MGDVDETMPPTHLLEVIFAARRGYLKSLEREVILSNEVALLKIQLFGKSSEKIQKQPDPQVFDEAK